MTKLYDLRRETRIDVSHLNLVNKQTGEPVNELNFHHVDGMYSLCTDDDGNKVHLMATTNVKAIKTTKK